MRWREEERGGERRKEEVFYKKMSLPPYPVMLAVAT